MPWFAIRTIYAWGPKESGGNVFEERIVAFEATDVDTAFLKAQDESGHYARTLEFEAYPEREAYFLDDEALVDGHELFSQLFEARLTLDEFFEARYVRFRYEPAISS